MNTEETKYDENTMPNESKSAAKGKNLKTAASMAGAAVVGAGATMAGTAMAADGDSADEVTATATGAKVGIVADGQSFGEAFAAAREQVGPGGVFEWHGKLYNTYTKEEWSAMSDEEKQEFASEVKPQVESLANANQQASAHHHAQQVHASAAHANHQQDTPQHHGEATDASNNIEASNDTETGDVDVQVIDVQHNVNMNGQDIDVAYIKVEGHNGVVLDIDQDGTVEGIAIDTNDNNNLDEGEYFDATGSGISMPQDGQTGNYMAQNDDTPDYNNDVTL